MRSSWGEAGTEETVELYLSSLTSCCASQNDPARAMMYLGKGLELAEGLGNLDLKATMLCNMGNVLMQAR